MFHDRNLTMAGPLDMTVRKLNAKLSGWDDHELLVVRAEDIRRLIAFYEKTKPSTPWLIPSSTVTVDLGLDYSEEFRDLLVGALPTAPVDASEAWRTARSVADC